MALNHETTSAGSFGGAASLGASSRLFRRMARACAGLRVTLPWLSGPISCRMAWWLFAGGVQSRGDIGHEVRGVLDTHRQSHQIRRDRQFRFRHRRVRHHRGELDQGFDPAEGFSECEQAWTHTVRAADSPPRTRNETIPPKSRI